MSAEYPSRATLRFTYAISCIAFLVAILVLFGWLLGIASLTNIVPEWPRMVPLTACCFTLIAASLWLNVPRVAALEHPNGQQYIRPGRERVAVSCASLAALIGLVRLVAHLAGWQLGLDSLGLRSLSTMFGASAPATMSPATALAFALLGGALTLGGRSQLRRVYQTLAICAFAVGWLGVARYVLGGAPLIPFGTMAMHTALLFVALSAAALSLRSDIGLPALLVSEGAGGAMARYLLPAALFIPLGAGALALYSTRAGGLGTEAALSLFALSSVLMFAAIIWTTAAHLERADVERRTDRTQVEERLRTQLARLNLLDATTRAIGERQDLRSIFQVVVRSLEEHLPVDFGCICMYDESQRELSVTCVGIKSHALALSLALPEQTKFAANENGLGRCVRGELVYEPDLAALPLRFPSRLAQGGLRSLVMAPLLVERKVFGIMMVARHEPNGFSSGDCEFLRQLSAHVALASHQAQLYTSLQRAYEDLRQTQQSVLQQERLRALGQMASGVAHDINNALSPASLYAQSLIERDRSLSPATRDYLIIIQRAIEDVAQTVGRLREFYRPREPLLTLAPVDLNRLLRQVVDLTRARWSDMPQERGIVIHVETDLAPDVPTVMGAESEIRDALTNLVLNAVDAMPDGGTLTLRTRCARATANANTDAPLETRVSVEVCDSGIGMSEAVRDRCLEPFFTSKGDRGTGLGLAMVYGMVQRHSAELEIESELGTGTTMRLIFKVAAQSESLRPDIGAQQVKSLRVLAVDDDPLILKSLQQTLELDGHDVVIADGGQAGIDAFAAAQKRGEPFAVAITDLGMPKIDGRTVAAAIKTSSPATPVILLTGWGHRLQAEGALPEHVDHVLAKPPRLNELRAALARIAG
jgi:signal transduction histidine kinase/ActR/RegA family two-component response regulator